MAGSACSLTPSPASPDFGVAEAFALQACDDTDSLREVLCAYACLEKLIVPLEVSDTEQLNPTRSELSALLRLVNDELSRRIEAVDKTVHAMRGALTVAAAN
ncbi:hypothetical protein [Variovorax boronicumulans]|jgi:hypothetical protein|uniref:hypothetical protein n=1 Tax=Variovorax boronicumulans TaxID=436515 RepID=UPI0007857653|nr:hypothetical protein [Variovorax boronicumulans]